MLLIRDIDSILTLDGRRRILNRHSVLIEDGRIARVGETSALDRDHLEFVRTAGKVIEGAGCVMVPALREHARSYRRAPEPRSHPRRPGHLRLGQSLCHAVLRVADRGGGLRQRAARLPRDALQRHRFVRRRQHTRVVGTPGRGCAGGRGKRDARGAGARGDGHPSRSQAGHARGAAGRGVAPEHRRRAGGGGRAARAGGGARAGKNPHLGVHLRPDVLHVRRALCRNPKAGRPSRRPGRVSHRVVPRGGEAQRIPAPAGGRSAISSDSACSGRTRC